MIKRTMSEVDTNKDGKLSSTEFGTFLTHLLEGLSQKARPTSLSSASGLFTTAAAEAATSAADGPFFNVPGFDFGKLQNTTYVSPKYSPAVRAFSQAIAAENLAPVSGSLSKIGN
jgi:hypothetical protein